MRIGPICRVLSVAMIVGLLQLVSPPWAALAVPAAPTGLRPSGTTTSGQPVLAWDRMKGAAKYEVQLSTSDTFATMAYTVTTTNRRATPTVNLPRTELSWRVRGISSAGGVGAWAATSFINSTVAGPTLLTPLDDPDHQSPLRQPQDPALLTWTPVANATGYTVEVDGDNLFVQAFTDTSKSTSYLMADPGPQQTYFWHVQANFAGGFVSEWSDPRQFDVQSVAAPQLTYPDDSATTTVRDAVLDWEPVPGAVKYDVRVSTDDQFNTIIDAVSVKSTRYARPLTYDNNQYWWQVRAVDVNTNASPWTSSLQQFQRNWPDQPVLVRPANGTTVGNPLYFQWTPVAHASRYTMQLSQDPNFTTSASCSTDATTYTPRFLGGGCTPAAGGLYFWRVRALDGPKVPPVDGIYSASGSFTYSPTTVTQTAPVSGATVDVPALTWDAYPEAVKYQVVVKKASGVVADSATTYSTSWTPTSTVRLRAIDGPFRWTVQAIGEDGALTQIPLFSAAPTFSLSGIVADDPGIDGLTPASPVTGTHSTRFPALAWEPYVAGGVPASYYTVSVSKVGSTSSAELVDSFAYSAGTDSSTAYLTPATYEWFVTAHLPDGGVMSGPSSRFIIDNLNLVSGQRLSLTGAGFEDSATTCSRFLSSLVTAGSEVCGNLQQTPVFRWDPVPSAGYYVIYLYNDRELTNPVANYDATETSNTMWTPTRQVADSQAGTAYYWYVQACKSSTSCSADPRGVANSATNAFDKRSNPISGLTESEHDAPAVLTGNPPAFANEVVLSWDDYLATNQLGNDRDVTAMPSTVEASSYRVQISSDANFSSGFVYTSPLVDQKSFTPYSTTLPEGALYWRVQAIDGSGNSLAWSLGRTLGDATRAMVKISPTPVPTQPATDARVEGTPFFTWEPLAYAARYEIQVFKNDDMNFSTANRVISGSTEQAAYAADLRLPANELPYLWRVRKLDVDGRFGSWSEARKFTVKGDPPTQTSPALNAYVSGKDALFSWLPVDGAATYRFERRVVGSTSSSETVTTVGLSWAPLTVITDGAYEWRVSAYDSNGTSGLLGQSPWRAFRVDSTVPTLVGHTPTRTATRTANFVATFSEPVRGVGSTTMAIFLDGNVHRLSANVTINRNGTIATLDPADPLTLGKTYTVKLLSGITDLAGNALRPTSWSVKVN